VAAWQEPDSVVAVILVALLRGVALAVAILAVMALGLVAGLATAAWGVPHP